MILVLQVVNDECCEDAKICEFEDAANYYNKTYIDNINLWLGWYDLGTLATTESILLSALADYDFVVFEAKLDDTN